MGKPSNARRTTRGLSVTVCLRMGSQLGKILGDGN
jgi:hypothetical protein